ncbi:MAG: DUF4157 domain-containing protein [Rubrivivax sp.]|nr:DUF4157 domain-containing protein [Rubrivivax sp.]
MTHGTTGNASRHARDIAQRERIDRAFGGPMQRVEDEDELQRRTADTMQRREDDEEPLQGRFGTAQRQDTEEEEPLQARAEAGPAPGPTSAASSPGGLPVGLRQGIESLSGMDLSDVRVHTGSSRPAEIQALAYTQGNEIHVAPGQEQHLPHEAWHVVQQRQGRVRPTRQMKDGVQVNDEPALEQEADAMGAKASSTHENKVARTDRTPPAEAHVGRAPLQRESAVGEYHLSRTPLQCSVVQRGAAEPEQVRALPARPNRAADVRAQVGNAAPAEVDVVTFLAERIRELVARLASLFRGPE